MICLKQNVKYNFKKALFPLCDNRHKFKYGSWLRRPNYCRATSEYRAYKKVLHQFLVYGIGDLSRFCMMPNRSLMNLSDPLNYLDLIWFHSEPSGSSLLQKKEAGRALFL